MGRTIGRRWPADAPRGDHQAPCSHCGVLWRRSQLRREAGGTYACPDEGDGRSAAELSKGNARAAAAFARRRPPAFRGGPFADGLVRATEAPEAETVYDDPLTRFGARLVGWWTCTADYAQESGSEIFSLQNRASYVNNPSASSPGITLLYDDPTLERQVMQAGDGVSTPTLEGFDRAVPVSYWLLARITPAAAAAYGSEYTLSGWGLGEDEFLSSLRVTPTGVRARWRQLSGAPTTISAVVEAEPLNEWNVYGLIWTDTGKVQLTVNGAVWAEAPAPQVVHTLQSFYLVANGSNGTFIADAAGVSGTVSDAEALAQSRYMRQIAGLE